jgi:hypothetical protein
MSRTAYIYHNYYGTKINLPSDRVIETRPYDFIEQGTKGHQYIVGNVGKDIGGKLFGLFILQNEPEPPEFLVLLHDKKSPQVVDGDEWREKLSAPFMGSQNLKVAENLFDQDENLGILCAKGAVSTIADQGEIGHYGYNNKELILDLANRHNCLPEEKDFVAGTMFMLRYALFHEFFGIHAPLSIRGKCEKGNVLDYAMPSFAHAWERLLSWIVTAQGLTIRTV